ncbi:MAG: alpha/beta fold hydrolase [Acidimicrobiales bacterium]
MAPVPHPLEVVGTTAGRALGRHPLAAWQHGDHGPLVVAVPGVAETARYWDSVVGRLAVDHRVVTVDLLGFGRSPWPELGYTMDGHAGALAATLDAVTDGEPAVLVGHQAGVAVAMAHAARAPAAVAGIVGIGTPWYRSTLEARRSLRNPWWLARWLLDHEDRARRLCRTLCGGGGLLPRVARLLAPESVPPTVVHDLFLHRWESLSGTLDSCWTGADLPGRYGVGFAVPMVALHGDDDVCVPVENLTDAARTRPWLTVDVARGEGFTLAIDAPHLVHAAVAELAARPPPRRLRRVPPPQRAAPAPVAAAAPPAELSAADAAVLARVTRRTVHGWVESGAVAARRQGNRFHIDRASLVAHLVGDLEADEAERLLALSWLTASEAAARLGVGHATVERYVSAGMPSHRVAGRRIFVASELDAWAASRPARSRD